MAVQATFNGALAFPPRFRPAALTALWDRCKGCLRQLLSFFAEDEEGRLRISTEELIRRFQHDQPHAFEALYERYKDYVYRIALFVTRNGGDAEEAVQETFLDVLRALPHYVIEGPARFETWLYRVAVNRCRTLLRRVKPPTAEWQDVAAQLEAIPTTHPDDDPEGSLLRRERATALWRAVDELSAEQRMVVLLRYQHEFSYGEIAAVLGVSAGTVKSRLYYAHRRLESRIAYR